MTLSSDNNIINALKKERNGGILELFPACYTVARWIDCVYTRLL